MKYNLNTNSITDKLEDSWTKNEHFLSSSLREQCGGIKKLIDIQFEIASYFEGFWVTSYTGLRKGHRELLPLMHSLFHRNFFQFFSALKLTIAGMYLPARPLLRSTFEAMMIAKFCHVSENLGIMKRWHSEESVYFANTILKKIINPDPQPFFTFWKMICEYSHATKAAIQYSLEVDKDDNIKGVIVNFAIIEALLECNYHLLNSHLITRELGYASEIYTTRVVGMRRPYKVPELRKTAHQQFKQNRYFMGPESINLIAAYKRKWTIKHG